MNYQEKQTILRRIVNGYFYTDVKFKGNEYRAKFIDPTQDILSENDYHLFSIKNNERCD
jgi:hypothetical protein